MTDPKVQLDTALTALANEHRRAIIEALGLQPHSISRLAEMRGLSLPAIHKHITVLEEAGIVNRRKTGRTNYLALRRDGLQAAQEWLGQFHTYWGSDKETLENYVAHLDTEHTKEQA